MEDPIITWHARERIEKRLIKKGYTFDDVINDIKKSKLSRSSYDKFRRVGKLAHYIVSKDGKIITIVPSRAQKRNKNKKNKHYTSRAGKIRKIAAINNQYEKY